MTPGSSVARWVVPLPTAALHGVVQPLRGFENWVKAMNTQRRSTRKVGPAPSVQHNRPLLRTEESTVPRRREGKRPSPGSEASLRNRAGSGKSRGDIYPALWLPTAQLFSHSAPQDSMSGFHRHCIEDGSLSSKAFIILLFTSTVCRPQGKKLALSLLC